MDTVDIIGLLVPVTCVVFLATGRGSGRRGSSRGARAGNGSGLGSWS